MTPRTRPSGPALLPRGDPAPHPSPRNLMSKVAVLRTSPETVVEDYGRLMDLAGYRQALPFDAQTCLRINISCTVTCRPAPPPRGQCTAGSGSPNRTGTTARRTYTPLQTDPGGVV